VPGGTCFFTLVTQGRATFLCDDVAPTIPDATLGFGA